MNMIRNLIYRVSHKSKSVTRLAGLACGAFCPRFAELGGEKLKRDSPRRMQTNDVTDENDTQ